MKILIAMFLFANCQFKQDVANDNYQKTNTFRDKKIKLCYKESNLNLTITKDSIIGKHCFVFSSGNRIDCSDEDIFTIFMKKTDQNNWSGIMKSQYSDQNIKINLCKLPMNIYKLTFINYDLAEEIKLKNCELKKPSKS